MENMVYVEFLVEDKSGGILLEEILRKYELEKNVLHYNIRTFKGIGKLPKKLTKLTGVKTKNLLNDLPKYLAGFDKSMQAMNCKTAIVVVLDCDDEDCKKLKADLLAVKHQLNLITDTFFCIAIEEMEAWLLGDSKALFETYPEGKKMLLQGYVQDSIVETGTWEKLADIVYPGGYAKLKKEAASYYEIGQMKCEWAKKIGEKMNLTQNTSPSFQHFISKLDQICS